MRLGIVVGLVLGFAMGLAGCRSPDGRPPSAGDAPDSIAATGTDPIEPIDTIDEIVYELTGGIAGFQLKLTIDRSGAAVVYDAGRVARRGRLTLPEWAEIEQLVVSAKLDQMPGQYGRAGAVADAMDEVVTVRWDGQVLRRATVTDPANEPPEGFRALNARLRELALTLPVTG
jgi:hypothetical protein